jgi:hypothetical protein
MAHKKGQPIGMLAGITYATQLSAAVLNLFITIDFKTGDMSAIQEVLGVLLELD